jgi:hypothetical protein
MTISRRSVIICGVGAMVCVVLPAESARAGVTLGAIRWDPWYETEDTGERATMEYVLDPKQWRSRAPRCATITNGRLDLGPCATQGQIDDEIHAAHKAKIDYWAFCWYGTDNPMQKAWQFYQKSAANTLVNWCIIIGSTNLANERPTDIPGLVALLQGRTYHTVESQRPLLYLLHDQTPVDALLAKIESLRAACVAAGVGNPYIVLMIGASIGAVSLNGVDAIGIYSKPSAAPHAAAYADLVASTEAYWRTMANTGQSMVPTALTGADRRPRVERPVPWEAAWQKPFVGDDLYYEAGTPALIAAHVHDMVLWIVANRTACPAQTGLIYSWDEHDEGGSTLNPSLDRGAAILEELRKIL